MRLIVKGMEVPKNCFYCELMQKTEDGECMKYTRTPAGILCPVRYLL